LGGDMKKNIFIAFIFVLLYIISFNTEAGKKVQTAIVEFSNATDWWGTKMGTHVADKLINKMNSSGYYSFASRSRIHQALTNNTLPYNIFINKEKGIVIGNEVNARLLITGKIESIKVAEYHRYVLPPRRGPKPHKPLPPPKAKKRYVSKLKVKLKVKVIDIEANKVIWEGTKSGDATFAKGVLLPPGAKGAWAAHHADSILNEALNKIVIEINKKTEYMR
jgi:hypothetical protein